MGRKFEKKPYCCCCAIEAPWSLRSVCLPAVIRRTLHSARAEFCPDAGERLIDAYGPFFSWISKQPARESIFLHIFTRPLPRDYCHAHQLLLAAWKIDSPIKFLVSHFFFAAAAAFDFVLWTGTRLLARWLYTYVSSWCHITISREELNNITAG